ncbi:MAG: hypothetical protein QMD02_04855 [Bacteroidales bacterium]|jgi:hypothetical protein|nr:hypothetical protein [Bacteroidales bacterium]
MLITKAKIKRVKNANLKGITFNKLYRNLKITFSEIIKKTYRQTIGVN